MFQREAFSAVSRGRWRMFSHDVDGKADFLRSIAQNRDYIVHPPPHETEDIFDSRCYCLVQRRRRVAKLAQRVALGKGKKRSERRRRDTSLIMRTKDYFQLRASRADRTETLKILEKAGKGKPALEGDEIPASLQLKAKKKNSQMKSVRKTKKIT